MIRRAPAVEDIANSGDKELESIYLGLNYYYSKAVTFMVGYEKAEALLDDSKTTEIDGLRTRVQVLW